MMEMSFSLATPSRTLAHSRTWETLPAADGTEERVMVWMESTMTTSGFSARMVASTVSRSPLDRTNRSGALTPSRMARSLICRADSSPETYSTLCPLASS